MSYDVGAEFAVKCVRQTVFQFVSVGAEQTLEGMSHNEKADAVVEKFSELVCGGSRVFLSR